MIVDCQVGGLASFDALLDFLLNLLAKKDRGLVCFSVCSGLLIAPVLLEFVKSVGFWLGLVGACVLGGDWLD